MSTPPPPDNSFWLERWQTGRIGWHRDGVMPLLRTHWPALGPKAGERVLVPLCGKSLDMLWLREQGQQVLGVELSPIAIDAFFTEHGLALQCDARADGMLHRGDGIAILQADVLQVDAASFADCALVYDRAALIALPAELHGRYVRRVYDPLPQGARGLLITLEYPQAQKAGPPFAVHEDAVRRLLEPQWQVRVLERRDILADEPGFAAAGVTALHTVVYALLKLDAPPADAH